MRREIRMYTVTRNWMRLVPVVFTLGLLLHLPLRGGGYSVEKATFSVKIGNETIPYKVFGIYVLPEEKVEIKTVDYKHLAPCYFNHSAGHVLFEESNRWIWQAPEAPGLYSLQIGPALSPDSVALNVFVMIPYTELREGYLEDYHIGVYPANRLQKLTRYRLPKGFIRVTKENEETFVSPHFKLKQFLCKQKSSYPKFVVMKEKLLLKLELILDMVNQSGFQAATFHIMSGYRTPYYNHAIGNVKNSRHIYGEAADIFIDEQPKDTWMDDLNRDGKIDIRDAEVLFRIVDNMYGRPWYAAFIGGLGRYRKTTAHGPFVHVDVRGFRARWGD
ncbi:MAG: DUF882 domain-containing protein [Candidatus Aminicenantes bacterium]|nr:DUF882 domain-containing protein [Candidatus Aminicenantes bacterium]